MTRCNLSRPFVLSLSLLFILPFDCMWLWSDRRTAPAAFWLGFVMSFTQSSLGCAQIYACVQDIAPSVLVGAASAFLQCLLQLGVGLAHLKEKLA